MASSRLRNSGVNTRSSAFFPSFDATVPSSGPLEKPIEPAAISRLPAFDDMIKITLRKSLLRLQDATRLETGAVTLVELHCENSPFAKMDFRRAHLNFRPRVSA